MIKLTKKCLKTSFLERFTKDKTLLLMFQVWQGMPGINPQVFSASTWERGYFFMFLHFSNFGLQISKNVQANPYRFITERKKGPLNICTKFQRNTWNQTAEAMIENSPFFQNVAF